MKILKKRWVVFFLGCALGSIVGVAVTLKAYNLFWNQYEVGKPMLRIITSMKTIHGVEKGDEAQILSLHQMLLRGDFVGLVELHKTGDYPEKEAEIEEILRRAKDFMVSRPGMFIEQSFATGTLPQDEESTTNATMFMREQLQYSFDYVDTLPQHEQN